MQRFDYTRVNTSELVAIDDAKEMSQFESVVNYLKTLPEAEDTILTDSELLYALYLDIFDNDN